MRLVSVGVPGGRAGAAAYTHAEKLANPGNDASLIADTLRDLGFVLIGGGVQQNLDKPHFDRAIRSFGQQIQGTEVALFYYAGHGMQVDGTNWLQPVDANPTQPRDVDFQMVDAGLILKQMDGAGTRLNIVLLDARRNNPFANLGTRPIAGGLDIFRIFNEIGLTVKRETKSAQLPWVSSSPIDGAFFFANGDQPPLDSMVASLPPVSQTVPRSAEDNDATATARALSLITGTDVPPEPAVGIRLLEKTADSGYAPAQFQRGSFRESGLNTAAARWYKPAAGHGSTSAQFNLGRLYAAGEGVGKDPEEAKKWFAKVAAGGHQDAVARLAEMQSR